MGRGLRLDGRSLGGPAPVIKSGKNAGMEKIHAGIRFRPTLIYRVDMAQVLSKRNLRKHMSAANKSVLLFWHDKLRSKHFTAAGSEEYKYQRRSRTTVFYKKKVLGHNLPLVSTGDARSLTGSIKALRSTPNRGSLTMAGPWYLGYRVKRKDGKMSPDLKSELTRISARDGLLMARLGAKLIRDGIKADKKAKRIGARTVKP